jgi:hypothetical protein
MANSFLFSFCFVLKGGIRCERATALVNQLSSVNPNFKPEAVYELQGGIERYLKTYPEGGFWKGKNYLFDRRMEQVPENKPKSELEQDEETFNSNAKCAVCRRKWTTYRGKFKCASPQGLCGVPVLICDNDDCKQSALLNPKQLVCELCIIGHKAPQLMPDLVGLKRKAEEQTTTDGNNDSSSFKKQPATDDTNINDNMCKDRLFLRRLPLTATKTKLQELLGKVKLVHWLSDKNSGAFYGSCIVQLESEQDAQQAATSASGSTLLFEKKKIKVSYCREDPSWPPANLQDKEYPPIGRYVRLNTNYDLAVLYIYYICTNKRENDDTPTRHFPLSREVAVSYEAPAETDGVKFCFCGLYILPLTFEFLPTLLSQVD